VVLAKADGDSRVACKDSRDLTGVATLECLPHVSSSAGGRRCSSRGQCSEWWTTERGSRWRALEDKKGG
jgi:hypothetical protein